MSKNGKEQEGRVVKKCPFMGGQWCMGKECALNEEMRRGTAAGVQVTDECSFKATNLLLSEINMKTQSPQAQGAPLSLPNVLYRG